MRTLKFTKQNIEKIKQGIKTCTSRTFRLKDGVYKVDEELSIEIKGHYYRCVYDMYNPNGWAVAEGYEDWEDMYNNCIFRHTKEFMEGFRDLWVYTLKIVK